ncbi:type III polyketide synthase [Agrococcus sp. SGAir0287]|uniref:type III polyketide synthase n=1 Tax=Agrococcus sp. SGAir0287 TaxID=2070347 RepID=UPI0020C7B6DC|nr:type III polyketide synthase [Agrococcus sp. SGAir0287]
MPASAPAICAIGTAVPAARLEQQAARDLLARQPDLTRLGARLVRTAFDASAIDARHVVLDELVEPRETPFFDVEHDALRSPSTRVRNTRYAEHAPTLALDAASAALADGGLEPTSITHVVTASCTGFFAPGIDHLLVRDLGLPSSTPRLHVGFMGCYAAFPALRAADAICRADPRAVVLVVCVELCSLHLRSSSDPDTIVASSVFADGAGAAIVAVRPQPRSSLRIDALASAIAPSSEEEMAWTIGDEGFEMVLSGAVPRLIGANVVEAIAPLADARRAGSWPEVAGWAVHPGGRAILDTVQRTLGLDDAALAPSRRVLAERGNMSSATVLHILQAQLRERSPGEQVCAMAFGPGLTMESALLTMQEPA